MAFSPRGSMNRKGDHRNEHRHSQPTRNVPVQDQQPDMIVSKVFAMISMVVSCTGLSSVSRTRLLPGLHEGSGAQLSWVRV